MDVTVIVTVTTATHTQAGKNAGRRGARTRELPWHQEGEGSTSTRRLPCVAVAGPSGRGARGLLAGTGHRGSSPRRQRLVTESL